MTQAGPWNPWTTLQHLDYVELKRRRLDDADALLLPGPVIVLDTRLDQSAANAALAHELVHFARGGGVSVVGMPPQWAVVAAREEIIVDRVVADGLVPAALLRVYLARRASISEPVSIRDVADEFDVPLWVAEIALRAVAGDRTASAQPDPA